MLMRRRGVHSGLVVKVLKILKVCHEPFILIVLYHKMIDQEIIHHQLPIQGEEGALSMTTRSRSPNASKGLPVNYCSGFRLLNLNPSQAADGMCALLRR